LTIVTSSTKVTSEQALPASKMKAPIAAKIRFT
jgi:hypothetical protein